MRCPGKSQAVGQAADKWREEFERLQETDLMEASSRFPIFLVAKISGTYWTTPWDLGGAAYFKEEDYPCSSAAR